MQRSEDHKEAVVTEKFVFFGLVRMSACDQESGIRDVSVYVDHSLKVIRHVNRSVSVRTYNVRRLSNEQSMEDETEL